MSKSQPTAVFAAFLLGIATIAADPEAPRPNVLFILADDLGCETLGSYGGTSYATPHLDALAKSGQRYTHGYSMAVCHPTRITLLTGRYPVRFGKPRWGTFPKAAEAVTLAKTLRKAGYKTAVAGKWQLTLLKKNPQHPHQLGFDHYSLFGWHEGPRYYDPLIWQDGRLRDDLKGRYGPDVYCDFLIDFMKKHREDAFFAFYSMALCHDVTDDLDAPVPFGPRGRYDNYKEMVEAMDARVGRLVAALERLGLRKKTLVVFTGDNGTPRRSIITAKGKKLIREPISSLRDGVVVPGGKGLLTDGGTRVPLIASWPGRVAAGEVVGDLVDCADFYPTFAALAGATLPEGVALDGYSFVPRLLRRKGARRPWVYAQHGKRCWARTADWKLYNDGRVIDMRVDPGEKKPLKPEDLPPEAAKVHAQLAAALRKVTGEGPGAPSASR